MIITQEYIRKLIEEKVDGPDYFIVDVAVKPGNKIIVEMDSDEGVSIDYCANISRFIARSFDCDEVDYELKVSSPGLDQPLKILRQYRKNIGRHMELLTKSGNKITGKLIKADNEEIEVHTKEKMEINGTKKKQVVIKEVALQLDQIKEAKTIITFK